MKKRIALFLVFVMVLGLFGAGGGSAVKASGENSVPQAEVVQVVDQSVTDGNIRTLVTTEDTIATNTTVSGVIYVDGEISSTASLFKYSTSHYAVFVTNPVAGTTVKLGGIYTAGTKKVEFIEVEFKYDGVKWDIVDEGQTGTNPKAQVTAVVDQSITDGNIRTLVTTEDTIATNTTVSGVIYVDGEISTTASLFKYSASHYAVFVTNPVAGTTVKLGGIYTAGTKKVEFVEVEFRYDGVKWDIVEQESPKAEVKQVVDQSITDGNIRMWVDTGDTIAANTTVIGEVYVDGAISATTSLFKYGTDRYAIFVTEPTEGTTVRIGGVYTAGEKQVEFQPVHFVYDGTKWIMYQKEVDITTLDTGATLVLSPSEADNIANGYYAPLYGGAYVEDEYVYIPFDKAAPYYYLWDRDIRQIGGLTIEAGLTMTIDCVVGTETQAIRFREATFSYTGVNWRLVDEDAEDPTIVTVKLDVTGQADKAIWLNASPQDGLPYADNWSCQYRPVADAGLFVNGTRYATSLVKVFENTYLIPVDYLGFEVKDGTTAIMKGFFCDAEGNGIIVEELTLIYNEDFNTWTNPNSDKEIYREKVELDVTGQADKAIWLNASPQDKLPYDSEKWLYQYRPIADAGMFVDGTRYPVSLIKVYENTYLIPVDYLGFEVKGGTTAIMKGFFCDTEGNGIIVEELTLIYNEDFNTWTNPNSDKEIYREKVELDVTGQSDKAIWLNASPQDGLPYADNWSFQYAPATADAGLFVNGKRYAVSLIKVFENTYLIPSHYLEFEIEDGTEVIIKGYFCDMNGNGIIAEKVTLVYDEEYDAWTNPNSKKEINRQKVELDVTGAVDKALWLYPSPVDTLPHADNWTCMYWPISSAGLFVNGERYSVPLIKIFADIYLIPADYFQFELKDKTEVTLKGFFSDAKGNGPVIEEVTFVYHAEKGIWLKAGAKISADVDDEDYVDFNIVRKSNIDSDKTDDNQKTDTTPQQSNNNKLFIIIGIIAVVAAVGIGGIFVWRKQRRRNKE